MSKKAKKKNITTTSENLEAETIAQEELTKNEAQDTIKQEVDKRSEEEKLKDEAQAEKDKFLRLFAEFENYKKRTTKERIELFKTASQDVMIAMLPVLDDFERALNHIEDDKEAEDLRKGVLLIYQKLISTLKTKGLDVIEVKQGDLFDADNHEAVTQIPAPSDDMKGKIIDVIEKGYQLGDKVIRFPKVVIGQ